MTIKRVRPVNRDKAVGYYHGLLYALGYDTKSDLAMNAEASGRDTAQRAVDAYIEFFSEGQDHFHFTTFTNEGAQGMVVVANIEFSSMCAHHFLPYSGIAHIGYIPESQVCGLSKVVRVVDHYSHRPSIQENLTSKIATFLWEQLEPKGCGVIIKATHSCYSPDTEVLTDEGWRAFENLTQHERVYAVDPQTHQGAFVSPTSYVVAPYEGSLLLWKGRTMDVAVTPQHRMLVRTEWDRFINRPTYKVLLAQDIQGKTMYASRHTYYAGQELPASISVGGQEVSVEQWLAFLGFWMAEGCTTYVEANYGYRVIVTQSLKSRWIDAIRELLRKLPWNFREDKNGPGVVNFVAQCKPLFEYLRRFGKSRDKFVPSEVKRSSPAQRETFLDWAFKGDGGTSPYAGNPIYYSASKRLVDDVQEMLLYNGHAAAVTRHVNDTWRVTQYAKNSDGLLRPQIARQEDYSGLVYCANVPTGALLVRRNGHPVVCGNCMSLRGVTRPGHATVTSDVRGCFETPEVRAEFLSLIQQAKR